MYLVNSAKNVATVNEVKDEIKGDGGIIFHSNIRNNCSLAPIVLTVFDSVGNQGGWPLEFVFSKYFYPH